MTLVAAFQFVQPASARCYFNLGIGAPVYYGATYGYYPGYSYWNTVPVTTYGYNTYYTGSYYGTTLGATVVTAPVTTAVPVTTVAAPVPHCVVRTYSW